MNKNESKYFNTAAKMDRAFLELLEKKDFSYITVKEICERAGVNRSTFYLHYETIEDLLSESVEYMNERFSEYMKKGGAIPSRLEDCTDEELNFITPAYLIPYLNYVKNNRCLIGTAMKNTKALRLDKIYDKMFCGVFSPILERHGVPMCDRRYIMEFYIHGLAAIISEWLKNDCKESVEYIMGLIGTVIHA